MRGKARDMTSIPTRLPSPDLVEAPDEVTKTWEFSLEGDEESGTYWAINGLAYDAERIDHEVKLGSVEAWRMTNTSEITHYVHLHQQMWRTVSRNGQPSSSASANSLRSVSSEASSSRAGAWWGEATSTWRTVSSARCASPANQSAWALWNSRSGSWGYFARPSASTRRASAMRRRSRK